MSEEAMIPTPQEEIPPESWINIWVDALTKPSVDTFERLTDDPHATIRRAFIWMFITGALGAIVSALVNLGLTAGSGAEGILGFSSLILICLVPVGGLLAVLGLIISAGITQAIATVLGGEGSFSKLAYAYASYAAPLSLVSGALSSIPFVQCLPFRLASTGLCSM